MSTRVLEALPGKLDIKKHSPSILYVQADNPWYNYDMRPASFPYVCCMSRRKEKTRDTYKSYMLYVHLFWSKLHIRSALKHSYLCVNSFYAPCA